jgi:hypothetical protein
MVPQYLRFGISDEEPSKEQTGIIQPYGPIKFRHSMAHGGLVDAGSLTAYSQVIIRFDFAAGELSGALLSELSVGYNANGTGAYNRALVLDENRVPVPLVVLPTQTVTVFVRLRLYFMGWGNQVQVNNISGTVQMGSGIASPTNGVWRKGLPFSSARMATVWTSLREGYAPGNTWAKFYIPVPQYTSFSTTLVEFCGRTDSVLVELFFGATLVKPFDQSLHFRAVIAIARVQN